MVERTYHLSRLTRLLNQFPVVAILGPRQVGKTTLARQHAAGSKREVSFFDLEDTADLALFADPIIALRPLKGLIVVDEVQRRPELFPSLRVLADQPKPARRPRSPNRCAALWIPLACGNSSLSTPGRDPFPLLRQYRLSRLLTY